MFLNEGTIKCCILVCTTWSESSMTVYMCMHFSDGLFCHVKLACTLLHFKMEMFLFLTLNMQKVDH